MKRPLANKRPIGPFAQPSSSINFNATFKVGQSATDIEPIFEVTKEVEDNIKDRIMNRGTQIVEDVSIVPTRSDRVDATITTNASTITSRQEDIMVDEIEGELERVSNSEAELRKYKFML